ncbi:Exocyst complex subunit Sec15-like protein [Kalmanozyma brasiliensis GHG001]|uniref:Exocyst complex component SEC15 n=1 Tax=Kalmanozyma brasiliensis (strain GHG001) TaxID=1365824 RepID=V5ESV2_KALBG|nr:Exocyst complex subunit Sec15-like protein [Kalmanozyma brasiliensis GHG001]EST08300.1 Exocyst complex subunit Sec15-like protein [Kalmanozyma brasiliensis GHG001]
MVARPRRPLISLEAQLQQLTLFSDLDADAENLEQLGPIIKSLDEARQQDAFLRHLKTFVREKDREIEAVCDANHTEFVDAVDKLLKVRTGTVTLKHRIGELNEDVQAGGSSLGGKKRQLLETQRTAANVGEAIAALQVCLRVLDMANRADGLIADKKYYAALRSLQELENVHLRGLLHHEFARHMLDGIPQMRGQVKAAVTREMKEWLFEVREKSRTVGQLALETMENRQKRWRVKTQRDPLLRLAKVNSAIELVVNERAEHNFVDNDRVSIDFRPLYQCIHIYDALDLREELQSSYHEDRRAQANLLLTQGLTFDAANSTFPPLLEEMVGFFLVEHHVLQTTPSGFRSEAEVDDLWDTMCSRVCDIVSLALRECRDTKVYISAKAAIQVFIQTLEGYSFPVAKLNSLLLTLFERYAQLLRDRFSRDFQQAMRETQHQPMIVSNADELSKVLSVAWLKPGDEGLLRNSQFPLSLPFSQTYPLCCMDIRNLVDQYYHFSDGFAFTREIDEILSKSLDSLLIQQVSNGIRQSLSSTEVNLPQIAQIVVNAEHFNLACVQIEALLERMRAGEGRGGGVRLDASRHFVATLRIAEDKINGAFAGKLDQFLGLAEYDFAPPTMRATAPTAAGSPWLQDTLEWLHTMMESVLVLLPAQVREKVYTAAYAHLTSCLVDKHLLSPDTTAVNAGGLQVLNADIGYLATNAEKDGVEAGVFAPTKQLLEVVLREKVGEYVQGLQTGRGREEWAKLDGRRLVGLLERLGRGARGGEEAARRQRERETLVRALQGGLRRM